MSQDSSFLKNTVDLLESEPEIKSYIYQQILDFNPFVTPETLVMVVARDPSTLYANEARPEAEEEGFEIGSQHSNEEESVAGQFKYRIAIILKDGESAIEAEAFNNDIFEAIRLAKENLVARLIKIQEEMEKPADRIKAILEATDNTQIH